MEEKGASTLSNATDFDDFDFDEILDILGEDEIASLLPGDFKNDTFQEESAAVSLSQFLAMLDNTPPGRTNTKDISSIRSTLYQLAENRQESHTLESAQLVETLFLRLLEEYRWAKQSGDTLRMQIVEPTEEDFAMVMQVWINTGEKQGRDNVSALFFTQQNFFEETGLCCPSLEIVETSMAVLADSRGRDADRKAWAIVNRLADFGITPTVSIFHSLIASLARSRQRGAAQRAEDALMEAIQMLPPSRDKLGKPVGITVDSFNVVLTAWAKSELDDGPSRAEQLLVRMDEADRKQGVLKPTAVSFTSLIDAYAQMKTWESACRAERTLNALLNYYLVEDQDPALEPSIATWGIVLASWQRLSKKGSHDAASKAAKLLQRLEALHSDGKLSYAPDVIAYITVLNAWCQCKDVEQDGASHAERLLNEMNERYMDGDDSYKPSAKSVRSVVEAWVKSNRQESLFKAEEIFEHYDDMGYLSDLGDKEVVQDIYKTLIFGWSRKEDPERAHELLLEMLEQGFSPDSFCFDRVIEAYTADEEQRFDDIKEVFELMQNLSDKGGLKPNERVYTSYIRAMTKAGVPGLANDAFAVLQSMNELSFENKAIKPTVFTYNAVLKACATAISDNLAHNFEAFKIALGVFNELRSSFTKDDPDHVTFGNMLQCASLLPEGAQREAMVTSTFHLCCQGGFVNAFVIRDLQIAASEDLWRELCQCPVGEVNIALLPQSWVRRFQKGGRQFDLPQFGEEASAAREKRSSWKKR